jgi:hypothetical protein
MSLWDHTRNVRVVPEQGCSHNEVSVGPEKERSCNKSAAALPLGRPLCSCCVAAMKITGLTYLLLRESWERSQSQLALGSSLHSVVSRIVQAAIAWMLLESAGAIEHPGTPCSSLQPGLPILLVQTIVVESTECLAPRMLVSYTLLVCRARPSGDRRCYDPCRLVTQQAPQTLAFGITLLCGGSHKPKE